MKHRSWTLWGQEPGGERDLWYWRSQVVPVDADTTTLQAQGLVSIESEKQPALFLALQSQLAYLAHVVPSPIDVLQTYVQAEDLRYAEQYPVVLAFYASEAQQSADATADAFLPTHYGEIALIAEAGEWHSYSYTSLDDEGKATLRLLQEQVGRERQELEHTSLDVYSISSNKIAVQNWQSLPQHYMLYLVRYQHLHSLAQRLAAHYWSLRHHALNLPSQRVLPDAQKVISTGGAIIPAPQPVQAVLAAYSNAQVGAEGWTEVKSVPTFIYNKEQGTTSIEFRPQEPDVLLDDSTIQSLWHQVRQLSDIDGDVLLAMLAQAIATPHSEKEGIWITGKLILDYRGIAPMKKRENGRVRQAGHRQEDLANVAACVSRMSNTWIRVEQWIEEDINAPPIRRRGKKKQDSYLYTRESRLINVTDAIRQHDLRQEPNTTSASANFAVAWRYHIGSWVDPFLQGANRQVAWLLQQALSYDPYHEMWEKRLARYFTFHMRINTASGGTTIIREIGQLIEELSFPINQRDPERTRQRFEKAMKRLEQDALISEWGYHKDNPPLPLRKWLAPWLKSNIWITATPITFDRYLPESL